MHLEHYVNSCGRELASRCRCSRFSAANTAKCSRVGGIAANLGTEAAGRGVRRVAITQRTGNFPKYALSAPKEDPSTTAIPKRLGVPKPPPKPYPETFRGFPMVLPQTTTLGVLRGMLGGVLWGMVWEGALGYALGADLGCAMGVCLGIPLGMLWMHLQALLHPILSLSISLVHAAF